MPRPVRRLAAEPLEDRLAPAARLDPTFGTRGVTDFPAGIIDAMALQPDGKIVLAGYNYYESRKSEFVVARLNPDGTPDPTFEGDGKQTIRFGNVPRDGEVVDWARAVAVQPDGKIVVAGLTRVWAADESGPNNDMAVARLNPDGSLDETFGRGGKVTVAFPGKPSVYGGFIPADDRVSTVLVQPDGRILLAGRTTQQGFDGSGVQFALVRLNPDGGLDGSLAGTGRLPLNVGGMAADINSDGANAAALLPDGRVVLAGNVVRPADPGSVVLFAVARVHPNGAPDLTFDGDGEKTFTVGTGQNLSFGAHGVAVRPDGRVVLAGIDSLTGREWTGVLAQLAPDGAFDPAFGGGDGVVTLPIRVNSFGNTVGGVNDIALRPDGKIVAGMWDGGRLGGSVLLANPDGSPDPGFANDPGFPGSFEDVTNNVRAVAVQPDGRIVAAGFDRTVRVTEEPLPPDPVPPPPAAPTVSDIADQSVPHGREVRIDFTVADADTPADQLIVTAAASDAALLPGVRVEGTGATRTLVLTPDGGRLGTATVTVRADDFGGHAATDAVRVTVRAPDPPPAPANGTRVPAGEFNWFQATPDGTLAALVWNNAHLVYRTRAGTGWAEETVAVDPAVIYRGLRTGGTDVYSQVGLAPIASETGYADEFAVGRAGQAAQLLFAPDGVPHAFLFADSPRPDGPAPVPVVYHYRRGPGGWAEVEQIEASPGGGGAGRGSDLTAAVGPGGVFHLLFTLSGTSGDSLWYATNKSGGWDRQKVTDTGPLFPDVHFIGGRYAPRFLSVAADSQNNAHVAFTPRFDYGGRVFSQLAYATNRGGAWQTQVVYSPPDGTGDAGQGASVAVGPGDQVAIANYVVDRVDTGSPASAQLLYHSRRADGGWATSTVATAPDGYAGGDGPKFTGFSPHLVFRGGTPVVTFSDLAGAHLPATKANEMAGQIRTATLTPGGWALATVYRQGNPLTEQVFFPVLVEFQGQPVFAALRAVNRADGDGELTGWETFELIELNAPSIAPQGPKPGTPGGALGAGVVGAGLGGGPVVQAYNPDGTLRFEVMAFDPAFTGGVRTASADFNRDGVLDVVAGTGPGRATQVRILDGVTRAELFAVDPFEAAFVGGVYVAAGDVTGDGVPDLVITPDEGGGPRVRVFSGAGFGLVTDFFGIEDTNFRGGARAAVGDITGDRVGDLLVAAGFLGGPRVAGFDGKSLAGGSPVKVFGDFYAFEEALRNGVYLAAGDLDGDGFAELICGGGPGGGPRVTAFSGKALLRNAYEVRANFFAGDEANRGGVRLAVHDLDGDARADLVTGAGTGAGSRVTAYLGRDVGTGAPAARDFEAFAGFTGGVFVG